MAKPRICYTCMKQYSYCPQCGEDRYKPTWMFIFHEENCKKIYDILQKYSTKEYTSEEALKVLATCDLSHKDEFNPDVKADLQALLDTRVKKTRKKKIVNKEIENT